MGQAHLAFLGETEEVVAKRVVLVVFTQHVSLWSSIVSFWILLSIYTAAILGFLFVKKIPHILVSVSSTPPVLLMSALEQDGPYSL